MASAAILTLDQLVQDDDGFDMGGKGKSDKRFFEHNTAYHVEVTELIAKASKAGYLQAEVALKFVGTDTKAGRQWLMLPVFSTEMAATLDNIKLAELKTSFGKRLQGFLRAVMPEEFEVYNRLDKSEKKWRFFDSDGNEMTFNEKASKDKAVSKAVVKFAQELVTGADMSEFIGRSCYIVLTPNKAKPEYDYVNWYSEQPSKFPLADVSGTSDNSGVPF